MSYDTSIIRRFILNHLDDQEFTDFCFDYFPDVYNDLTTGMRFRQMVQLLLAYCERKNQLPSLMAALQRERDVPFEQHFAPVQQVEPAIKRVRNPRQIFISHATADAEVAHTLAANLGLLGWKVWIAPDSINPGEKWVEAINRGLEESSLFILLVTPNAVQSRWVTSETNVAIEMEHEGLLRFIPIQLKPCSLPALWRAYQRVPFHDGYEAGWQILLERLENIYAVSASSIEINEVSSVNQGSGVSFQLPIPGILSVNSYWHEVSGLELIRIPAGDFLYGEGKRKIYLPEYWIAKTPVTNAHYARFIAATGHQLPQHWQEQSSYPERLADYPVVFVNWHDVTAYCEWVGGRLPTEEEWEKAARGEDGRIYPWGNRWREHHCNSEEAGHGGTSLMGQFSPHGDSAYGCVDMSGNVWEWTDTWYDEEEKYRVLRGGAYWNDKTQITCSARYWGSPSRYFCDYRGFRVCLMPAGNAPLLVGHTTQLLFNHP